MRATIICLVILSAATTFILSRSSASYLTQYLWVPSSSSYKRQSNSILLQYISTCDPVQNELNAGCPMTTCCTQSFETSYYKCLLCVGIADNAPDYTQAQADLDQLYLSCYDSLQELTFPGQNSSRTLPTSSRDGTPTVAGTSPASVSVPTLVFALRSVLASTPLSSPTSASSLASTSSPAPSSSPASLSSPASPMTPASTSSTTSVSAPACISDPITLPSSASPTFSRMPTPAKGTTFSSTSTLTTSSAAPGLNPGGSGAGLLPP
ncbi:uncharacterized protein BJ212DRAFT_559685 [Suillus subaureus]|uniref:Uncharacterized protein n=1 Tax=Suillus subaureus TaxID=48587 RepID=A0A9P7E5E2_9AGAM|nr:uncharacterized protein BJ212DRAFT_559685 [Suillus subaureus]KAG1811187.1 hypothetical protein BJ212DRAFT_559685 [Suillus subaureus]